VSLWSDVDVRTSLLAHAHTRTHTRKGRFDHQSCPLIRKLENLTMQYDECIRDSTVTVLTIRGMSKAYQVVLRCKIQMTERKVNTGRDIDRSDAEEGDYPAECGSHVT